MPGDPVLLTEVLMALSVHEGKLIMWALRRGATITCWRQPWPDGPRYVLRGAVDGVMVTTGEHRGLNGDLVRDLEARLEPHLYGRLR
ncbi:hypothetical protein [Deinococcus yunweiensis]|uniref:hypothetical protein n=1 Tax=Deinococcus yunweiensis TaxID=367282 RepID=UPI00398ECCD0